MERSWSEAALAALDAYPWRSEDERRRAREEAELVAFGAEVEVVDKPVIGLISSPSYVLPDPGDPKFKMIEVCDGETITLDRKSVV